MLYTMTCREWYLDNWRRSYLLASMESIRNEKIKRNENDGLNVLSVDTLYIFCYGYIEDTCSVHLW